MRTRKSVAFGALLLLTLSAFISLAYATENVTWLSSASTATISYDLTGTYTDSISVKWTMNGIATNASASVNYAEFRIYDTDTVELALAIKGDGTTYYLTDGVDMIKSPTAMPEDANFFWSNATLETTVNNNKVSFKINGETLASGYNRAGDGNFTKIRYLDDFTGQYFTTGYIDVKVYSSATGATFESLVGVIIMVSVVSILIGAVKLKRR